LSLDVEREGLPEGFRDNISRALRHYGVLDLDLADDTDGAVLTALGESVYRIFLSQQRMDNQIPVIAEMLSRWLPEEQGGCGTPVPPESFAEVLDRLIGATQLRFPVIGDAARTLRFRLYDQPRIDEARRDAMDRIRGVLTRLASAAPDEDEYTAQITRLAQTPVPLSDLLAAHVARADAEAAPLLEVITRRQYEIRELTDIRRAERDGLPFVISEYDLSGDRLHPISYCRRLITSPRLPLRHLRSAHMPRADASAAPLRELLTRRRYALRELTDIRRAERDGLPFVIGGYDLSGDRLHLISYCRRVITSSSGAA